MFEILSESIDTLAPELPTILIAISGGLVLFAMKVTEHFNRPQQEKLSIPRYAAFFIWIFLGLPVLGGLMTSIYILNGDQISPILAFQVGLTSPAIVQSLIIAAANNTAKQLQPAVAAGQ